LGHTLVLQHLYSDAEKESLPGYEILAKQPSPPARWRQTAISDLATIYAALKRPDKAAKFESEMAKGTSEVIASASGGK
jgi:hypothetical protein